MIKIDGQRAYELLEQAVAQRGGDYVYEGVCLYTEDGKPRCGVGLALALGGVPLDVLHYIDYSAAPDGSSSNRFDNTAINEPEILEYLESRGVVLTASAQGVLRAFQTDQDLGFRWEYALESARFMLDARGEDE